MSCCVLCVSLVFGMRGLLFVICYVCCIIWRFFICDMVVMMCDMVGVS